MKYFILLALVLVGTYSQSNDIDVVLKLLGELKNNAALELETLERQLSETKEAKESVINTLFQSAQQQRGQCNLRDQDVVNKERDITITLSFMSWLEKRIKENKERIARLDLNRCQSNSNFINDIKNSKKALNMIKFLRKAITNAKEGDLPALLQSTQYQSLLKYNKVFLQEDDLITDDDDQVIDSEGHFPPQDEATEEKETAEETVEEIEEEVAHEEETEEVTESNETSSHQEVEEEEEVAQEEHEEIDEELIVGGDDSSLPPNNEEEEVVVEQEEVQEEEVEILGADESTWGPKDEQETEEVEVSANPLEDAEEQDNEELEKQAEAFNNIIAKGEKAAAADSTEPAVPGKDYSNYTAAQQELLKFLDELEGEIRGTFSKVQDNQVKSAMGFNDFKGLIFKENDAFKGHLVSEDENLIKLQNQLITVLQATAACKARLRQITQSVDLAQEDLQNSLNHFATVKARLEDEQNNFDDIYRIYANQVGSQSSEYKQDVQTRIKN